MLKSFAGYAVGSAKSGVSGFRQYGDERHAHGGVLCMVNRVFYSWLGKE
jgi:hypothetical protein